MIRVLPQNFKLLLGGVGFDIWEYVTPHSLKEMSDPGYFWPVASRPLKRLDKIVGYAQAESDHPVAFDLIVAQVDAEKTRVVLIEQALRGTGTGFLVGLPLVAPPSDIPEPDAVLIEQKRGPGRPRKEAA